jgi:hypothetical protein
VKLLWVLCLAVLLAVGCSGDDDGAETEAAPTPGGTTLATTTEEEPQPPGVAEDLNDVGGPLDLRRASAVRTGDLLAVSVTTYEEWQDDLLTGPRIDKQGPNRLTVLYDINLDGRADYTGKVIFAEGVLSLVISGAGDAFEPVPVERPDNTTAQFVHPVDVFFTILDDAGGEGGTDIQVAVESSAVGFKDRIPAEGWILVPFAPA